MEYRIDREALAVFVAEQVARVESVSVPRLLADVVEFRHASDSVSRDEARAL